MVESRQQHTIIALNPEKVVKARQDRRLLNWLENADLVIPDGIGVVVASRLLKNAKINRVAGSDLMPKICGLAAKRGYKVFLYGAKPETIEIAVRKLRQTYQTIQIVGYQHGYMDEANMDKFIDTINNSGAEILFVALGSPRQELWMDKHLNRCTNIRICQGVGGTFDVIAGTVKRAPRFFLSIHCEWLYRLLSQPARIYRQTALPLFIYQVFRTLLLGKFFSSKKFPN